MVVSQFSHVVEETEKLSDQLVMATGLTSPILSDAALKGAVWWQQPHGKSRWRKPVRLRHLDAAGSKLPKPGDQVLVNYNAKALASIAPATSLIRAFDNYSVFNKPGGAFSQGTKWGDHCSMPRMAEAICQRRCHLVHRLDRAAMGLMLLAHTHNATSALAELFATGGVVKRYNVTVHGLITEKLPISIVTPVEGRTATTIIHAATPNIDSTRSQLDVEILTGRKHQIRQHLAGIGFPVVGDRLFDKTRDHLDDLALAASRLTFLCPFSKQQVDISLPQ